ncbi:MAG TPA: alpha/beta hydrolase [Xanthomonadales bacterium]|nr:alpha/beta hydrolase [Xanthomonadales bacterium]
MNGPFGQIHYREAGSGYPLVLLHQAPSSSEMFAAAYPRLSQMGIRAIGLDTPGYGMSDLPDHLPSIGDYADALIYALRELRLAKLALLGHHTGASIAAEIAVRAPELVQCVILNGPPVMTREERNEYREALENAPTVEMLPDGSHLQQVWDRRVMFTPGWTQLRAMHSGVIQMLLAGEAYGYAHRAVFDHDVSLPLGKITQPGMILTNTGDDIYYAAVRARALRPDFEYVELAGGTHDIVDEKPDEWCKTVAGFVHHHAQPGGQETRST